MKLPIASGEGFGCLPCRLRPECGGPSTTGWSCGDYCNHCEVETCSRVCLRRPQKLALALSQVGGWSIAKMPQFPIDSGMLSGMPAYIPTIHHGSNVGFARASKAGVWAAIPLSKFFRLDKKTNVLKGIVSTEDELRKRFSLAPETNIVALGVGFDQPIEDYWRDAQVERLPWLLRQLGVRCFVPPNYSMFGDAPRTQHLHNRKRSLLCALRAAEAGLGVIPYLSALTDYDWKMIEAFLREHSEITHVAEEFQTGTASREFALAVIRRIADLQFRLGRRLHPVLIGAGRFMAEAKKVFDVWSLVDSNAFFDAQYRRRPVLVGGRIDRRQSVGKTSRNFARSVRLYTSRMHDLQGEDVKSVTKKVAVKRVASTAQLSLDLGFDPSDL